MPVNQRIKNLLKIKNRTTIYIAEKVKVSDGTIRNFKSGKTDPSIKFLEYLIEEHPSLNLNWLILGEGEMFIDEKEQVDSDFKKEVKELKEKMAKMESTMDLLKDKFREIDLEAMLMIAERMLEKERGK